MNAEESKRIDELRMAFVEGSDWRLKVTREGGVPFAGQEAIKRYPKLKPRVVRTHPAGCCAQEYRIVDGKMQWRYAEGTMAWTTKGLFTQEELEVLVDLFHNPTEPATEPE